MEKAEIRFIDGDYYLTQGDKKVAVEKLADINTTILMMPDGSKIVVDNLACKTIFQAACFLNDFHLEENDANY